MQTEKWPNGREWICDCGQIRDKWKKQQVIRTMTIIIFFFLTAWWLMTSHHLNILVSRFISSAMLCSIIYSVADCHFRTALMMTWNGCTHQDLVECVHRILFWRWWTFSPTVGGGGWSLWSSSRYTVFILVKNCKIHFQSGRSRASCSVKELEDRRRGEERRNERKEYLPSPDFLLGSSFDFFPLLLLLLEFPDAEGLNES